MHHKENFNGLICDVGTGISHPISYIKNYFDNVFEVTWDTQPNRIGDIEHSKADTSALENLGWAAQISLKTGLRRCMADVS
jgi:nucleoside-diphosphate-sugar epimerase